MLNDNILQNICQTLASGGVILYPTDTIWGIGCDATNPSAIEKVYSIKQRDPHKSMLILCFDYVQVSQYVSHFDTRVEQYLSKAERPTTVIYPAARNLPQNLVAADGSIGIRVPKSDFCTAMLQKFGKPVVSTSANFSGQPAPANFYDIGTELVEKVDFVVPEHCCDSHFSQGSNIIKITAKGEICKIR